MATIDDMTAPALDLALEETAKGRQRLAFARYCAFVLLGFAVGLGLTMAIAGSHWYMAHAENPGLRLAGYSQWIGRQNCKVVLYGDSSALTGLNPAVIEARTGLKTCNVAEGTVIQEITGSDVPLQAYLKQNPAPKYVLGMWTSSMFRPDQPAFQKYHPEGLVYALNYMNSAKTTLAFLRHPSWILQFASDTYQQLWNVLADRLRGHPQVDVRRERIARSGQWEFPLPPQTGCVRTAHQYSPSLFRRWPDSPRAFREKYTSAATKIILYIAPAPDCDTLFDVYAHNDAGLYDNTFERLPIRFFNQGDVHFSPEGSRYVSEQAAEQILHAEDSTNRRRSGAVP